MKSRLLKMIVPIVAVLTYSSMAESQTVPLVAPDNVESQQPAASSTPLTSGPILENVVITGLQRIEEETIISYLSLKIGASYNTSLINASLKKLYATGLFADVSILRINDSAIEIKVVENPIINRVAFEGNLRIKDEVLDSETQLRPRVVYTRTRVQSDVKRILDVYRRSGRFATKVEPKIIQLDQNRVDLAFEIEEGPDSGIHKISFIGNKYFSDGALEEELLTKQTRWYSFLSDADTYDPDKMTFDRELLRRYYLQNGFADFRVVSAVAELSEDKTGFYVTFTVDEGDRYSFGEFGVSSKIEGVDTTALAPLIDIDVGDWYNANILEKNVDALIESLNKSGYAFVDVQPRISRDTDKDLVNIDFAISESAKVYVERIEIRGNVRTKDEVLRREFTLVEGDAFNVSKLRRSRQRIRDLGYFKNVEVNNVPSESTGQTIVQVDLEEQSTGEVSIGGGYSTTAGILAEISIEERNFLGKGQYVRLAAQLGQTETSLDFSFTEPYFLNRELSAGYDLFHLSEDNQDISSSDNEESGFRLRAGYALAEYWYQSVNFRLANEEVSNVDDDASIYVQSEEGAYTVASLGQNVSYDRRNSKLSPTDGYRISLLNDFAGLGGDVDYFKTSFKGAHYVSFSQDDFTLKTSGQISNIMGLGGDDVRLNDRFYAGGSNFRGFDSGGIGPRDITTDDALGGKNMVLGSVELAFPMGIPKEFGIRGAIFTDVGTLFDTEESGSNIADENSLRSSIGVGMDWQSPLGPMRFDLAHAMTKESFDNTEVFRFSFGTKF